MSFPTLLGEFPGVVLALLLSVGCALAISFICLRFVVRLVTREQYNVTDAPRRIRALVWHSDAAARLAAADAGSSSPTGEPYLLPAAAPRNRFARVPKPGAVAGAGIVELSQHARTGTSQVGPGDHHGGAA